MPQLTLEQYQELQKRGLSDQSIADIARNKGYELPSAGGIEGISAGFTKGLLKTAVGITGAGQKIGQRILAGIIPGKTYEDIKRETGISALDKDTEAGKSVEESLELRGTAEKIGSIASDVATFFIPTAKTTKVAGKVITEVGQGVSKLGIGVSKKEAGLLNAYKARNPLPQRILRILTDETGKIAPVTNRETALKQGIFGTETMIGIQARRAAEKLWGDVISPALKSVKEELDMPKFINEMEEQIGKVEEITRKKGLLEALESFRDDYGNIGKITFEQLQKFKEGWAKFLPEKVYQGKPIAGAFKEIQNIASHLARNKIYDVVPVEVKAAYFDYGNLKNLQELGIKAMTRGKLKGGAGTFVSGIMDMALTPIASTGGLVLYKAGKGVEFVGARGINTVKQIFGL